MSSDSVEVLGGFLPVLCLLSKPHSSVLCDRSGNTAKMRPDRVNHPPVAEDSNQQPTLEGLVQRVSKKHDADVIVYLGPIDAKGSREMMKRCQESCFGKSVFLLIATYGGDPHAAYRLGRTLQRRYQKIIACVPGRCASGGTLMVLSAHTLKMSEFGVLGPLDIQIRKSDELFEWTSGLTVGATITALRQEAQAMFRESLFDLKEGSKGQITLRTAMDTAASLTTGMFGPLFAQIDPLRLGEDGRSTRIMEEYGERLARRGQNARPDAIRTLVAGYPSHNFEIDRDEARTLFHQVEEPNDEEEALIRFLGDVASDPPNQEAIVVVTPAVRDADGEQDDTTNDPATQGERGAEAGGAPSASPAERDPQVQPPARGVPESTSVN